MTIDPSKPNARHSRGAGTASPSPARHASDLLSELNRALDRDRIALGEIAEGVGDRAFGFALLIFALPNVIPHGLPGLSTLFGLPLLVIAAQLALGFPRPWLPSWLAGRTLPGQTLRRVLRWSLPWVRRGERLFRPRWPWLAQSPAERLAGVACLLLAGILALPIPFANVPMAAAISLIALGLIERDGVAILAGYVVAVGATVLLSASLLVFAEAALELLR